MFSILIVALTLASTQFGPRMLRNFIRDRGAQVTLGTFVATFFYAVLTLGSVSHGESRRLRPAPVDHGRARADARRSRRARLLHPPRREVDPAPEVIAGIARDLSNAIATEFAQPTSDATAPRCRRRAAAGPPRGRRRRRSRATTSGYLQFVRYSTIVDIASDADAVIELLYRPGHFVVAGTPARTRLAASAAPGRVAGARTRARHRRRTERSRQDLTFAIDQLVEIAIRALSPAVNDTFTALTCIDWLSDGLCSDHRRAGTPRRVHFDDAGKVRVIAAEASYERFVDRAFDKIRQAGRGDARRDDPPARRAREDHGVHDDTRAARVLLDQAEMILRSSEESVPEPADRADVRRRYDALVTERQRHRRSPPDSATEEMALADATASAQTRLADDTETRQRCLRTAQLGAAAVLLDNEEQWGLKRRTNPRAGR